MKHLVFVYGTLKENFPNFGKNQGIRVPGIFTTLERYPLYLMGERFSPCLIDTPGHGERVSGQVFEVDEAALATMDTLERITEADGYQRVVLELEFVQDQDARTIKACSYLKQAAHCTTAMVRAGPLSEYTLGHATLYQQRS